jgi:hypothetical protein
MDLFISPAAPVVVCFSSFLLLLFSLGLFDDNRNLDFGHVPISTASLGLVDEVASSASLLPSMPIASSSSHEGSFTSTKTDAAIAATAPASSPFAMSYFAPSSAPHASIGINEEFSSSTCGSTASSASNTGQPTRQQRLLRPTAPAATMHYQITNHNSFAMLLVDVVTFPPHSQFVVSIAPAGTARASSASDTSSPVAADETLREEAADAASSSDPSVHSFAEHALVLPPATTVSVRVTCNRITEVHRRTHTRAPVSLGRCLCCVCCFCF